MKSYTIRFNDKRSILPFAIKEGLKLDKKLKKTHEAWSSLERFMRILERYFREKIYSMGFDIIKNKCYERFMFEKNGFLEITMDKEPKIEASFAKEKKAIKFNKALDKTIRYFNKKK